VPPRTNPPVTARAHERFFRPPNYSIERAPGNYSIRDILETRKKNSREQMEIKHPKHSKFGGANKPCALLFKALQSSFSQQSVSIVARIKIKFLVVLDKNVHGLFYVCSSLRIPSILKVTIQLTRRGPESSAFDLQKTF
jgi:hypothetical protein